MEKELVESPIFVNTDEREADVDMRIERAKALGAVIVRFFEQREFSKEVVCKVRFFATTFTHNKVMEALEFADELLRQKGYVPLFSLQVEERGIGKKESEKKLSDKLCTVSIAVREIKEAKEFSDAVESAVSQIA